MARHKWTVDQLAEYLSTGWHQLHGAAAGPMADVTKNLGQASAQDVHAIAVYIDSLSAQRRRQRRVAPPHGRRRFGDASAEVMAIYNGACAKCHNDRNDVGPSKALSAVAEFRGAPVRLGEHRARHPEWHSVLQSGRRALYAGVRRHPDGRSDRLARRNMSARATRPAAMDRCATANRESKTGRSCSHDDLACRSMASRSRSTPIHRRRCFMSCATISACTVRNSDAGSGNAAPARCMSTGARRSPASCRSPPSADRKVTTLEGLLEDGKPNKLQQAFIDEAGRAMRLLHLRHGDAGAGAAAATSRIRPTTRSASTCGPIFAVAAPMPPSCARSSAPPWHRRTVMNAPFTHPAAICSRQAARWSSPSRLPARVSTRWRRTLPRQSPSRSIRSIRSSPSTQGRGDALCRQGRSRHRRAHGADADRRRRARCAAGQRQRHAGRHRADAGPGRDLWQPVDPDRRRADPPGGGDGAKRAARSGGASGLGGDKSDSSSPTAKISAQVDAAATASPMPS